MALTLVATVLLVAAVIPGQRAVLAGGAARGDRPVRAELSRRRRADDHAARLDHGGVTVALPIVAAVEAASLVVLLVNLATAHVAWLASLLGPVHGLARAAGIALALTGPYARRARWLSVVPGIGAALAARSRPQPPGGAGGAGRSRRRGAEPEAPGG